MQVKDTLITRIRDIGFNGEGIGSYEDFTVFIPYTLVDEEVKVAVDKVKGNLLWGHIIKMITPSPLRQEPFCALFGKCGGCDYQHLAITEQRKAKRENIITVFHKAGLEVEPKDIVGTSDKFYRNKIALPFAMVDGKVRVGFYKEGTHKVIPLPENYDLGAICPLHDIWVNYLVKIILDFCNTYGLSVYDERTGKGLLRHLVARAIGEKISIVLVINGNVLMFYERLVESLRRVFKSFSLHLSVNTKHNNVIFGDKLVGLAGDDALPYEVGGITAMVSPLAFLQINTEVANMAYNKILENIPQNAVVVEGYSGTGVLTTMIATKAKYVAGIEIIPSAVKNADENAKLNGVADKVHNYIGDAALLIDEVLAAAPEGDTKIAVVDPPRQGVAENVLRAMMSANFNQIIYMSCNPATLARDCKILSEKYEIKEVIPYDFFPHTRHVETVIIMSRLEDKLQVSE